jgi:hypothetical protein
MPTWVFAAAFVAVFVLVIVFSAYSRRRQRGAGMAITAPGLGQPASPANFEPGKASTVTSIVRSLAVVFLIGGLYFLPSSTGMVFPSLVSKSATATIDHCDNNTTCYGTWHSGTKLHTGQIRGDFPGAHTAGSPVDVYLNHGNAFTPQYEHSWGIGFMSACLAAIATGVILWWSARRKIKTGSWPWPGRARSA